MKKKKYDSVSTLVYQVFNNAGKANLLQLAQLRKVWFQKVDGFLSAHSYPHDLVSSSHFSVSPRCFEEEQKNSFSEALQRFLKQAKSKSFHSVQHFWNYQKHLKIPLTPEEEAWLQNNALLKISQVTLHLTVYDGSVIQAIHFNRKKYLSSLNSYLSGVNITDIHFHVGDLSHLPPDPSSCSPLVLKIPATPSNSFKSGKSSPKKEVQEIIHRLRKRRLLQHNIS